jgi:hypothetical protein
LLHAPAIDDIHFEDQTALYLLSVAWMFCIIGAERNVESSLKYTACSTLNSNQGDTKCEMLALARATTRASQMSSIFQQGA